MIIWSFPQFRAARATIIVFIRVFRHSLLAHEPINEYQSNFAFHTMLLPQARFVFNTVAHSVGLYTMQVGLFTKQVNLWRESMWCELSCILKQSQPTNLIETSRSFFNRLLEHKA